MMKLGYSGGTETPKRELDVSAKRLYLACEEYSDFNLFKDEFNLEDTFVSWAKVLQVSCFGVPISTFNYSIISH